MLEESLTGAVTLLAFAGCAALLLRLVRAAGRLALRAAEASAAAGLADVSARRGDVTGMIERQNAVKRARRERRGAMGMAVVWLAWLVVPAFAGWAKEAFALASLLWLVPRRAVARAATPPAEIEVEDAEVLP